MYPQSNSTVYASDDIQDVFESSLVNLASEWQLAQTEAIQKNTKVNYL